MVASDSNGGAESRKPGFWERKTRDPQNDRLQAALRDAERRLEALKNETSPVARRDQIVQICDACLRCARPAAYREERYVAWDCLHQFDDEMLTALSDKERVARWGTLRAEAKDKLTGTWRGEAVDWIIKQAPSDKEILDEGKTVPLHLLRELHGHLATAAQNQQHKLELFQRRSLPMVTGVLATTVVAAMVAAFCLWMYGALVSAEPLLDSLMLPPNSASKWGRALLIGIPAGALGGIVSMAFSLGGADLRSKIPDVRLSWLATITRPFLGAVVAIPVVVFIQAEFVAVKGFTGVLAIFGFCFLGGYSERWFLGVIERFEGVKK